MEAALAMILVLTLVNTVMHLAILDGINGVNMIRKMGNSIGVAINEIQKAIEEIRYNGEQHAEFVRSNGELVIAGLEMALDILNSTEPKPCDDTISRQQAIEVADAVWTVTGDKNVAKVWQQIKDLPPAEPEIIQCKDCKHYVYSDVVRKRVCIARYGKYFTDDNSFCSEAERRADD